MQRSIRFISLSAFLYFFVFCSYSAITPLQSINFGTIAVTNNSFPSSITIDPAGNTQVVGGLAIISAGNHGVYEISEQLPNTSVSVAVSVLNSQMIGQIASEETFTFDVINNVNSIFADNNGTAILQIGGRISTSGNASKAFTDTTFESTIQITINL